jgi:predicted TPR repeat methyltransferase
MPMDDSSDCLSLARQCLRRSDFDAAEPLLRRALQHDPKRSLAWELLAKILYRAARVSEAEALCRVWLENLPEDPVAVHLQAAFGGSAAPARASDAFITRLFDRAAEDFDTTLASLGYQVPRLVFESALRAFQGQAVAIDVLDAGCGTGLCGEWIRPLARRLIGVDLSVAMIEQSRRRGCYDELECAADVFCYFGALAEIFSGLSRLMRTGGCLVFSVEDLSAVSPAGLGAGTGNGVSGDTVSGVSGRTVGYRLLEHGRYAHGSDYVEQALSSAGLRLEAAENAILRYERGSPVHGLIVAAHAP